MSINQLCGSRSGVTTLKNKPLKTTRTYYIFVDTRKFLKYLFCINLKQFLVEFLFIYSIHLGTRSLLEIVMANPTPVRQ